MVEYYLCCTCYFPTTSFSIFPHPIASSETPRRIQENGPKTSRSSERRELSHRFASCCSDIFRNPTYLSAELDAETVRDGMEEGAKAATDVAKRAPIAIESFIVSGKVSKLIRLVFEE
mmetsp:Transcript_17732/g.35856  ORF Transcript_17732/g.35856 Transcript_17732/m.35856 type:complete len:118 (-) Transcript_17732:177-530(-)